LCPMQRMNIGTRLGAKMSGECCCAATADFGIGDLIAPKLPLVSSYLRSALLHTFRKSKRLQSTRCGHTTYRLGGRQEALNGSSQHRANKSKPTIRTRGRLVAFLRASAETDPYN
jgi:hypothetical protein